ncbi:MAG: ribosome silencing factor [Bacteroidota bacterium]|jgi:ribosome-associated protein
MLNFVHLQPFNEFNLMTENTLRVLVPEILADAAIEGIREKKGVDITILDLRGLTHAVCDFFIICTGNSSTQVSAIADSVEDMVRKKTGESPWHVEGNANAEWILIDFVNVVVHVFQPQARSFYGIEKLWADAGVKNYQD